MLLQQVKELAQWTVQKNAELLESALESAVGSSGESHRQEV